MKSSLLPERPLLISPTLAATIGLEEAVMLQVLAELIHSKEKRERASNPSLEWVALDEGDLQEAFPFWAPVDIHRVQSSLLNLGLIAVDTSASFYAVVDPGDTTEDNRVTRLQSVSSQESAQPREATAMPSSGSASLIAPRMAWEDSGAGTMPSVRANFSALSKHSVCGIEIASTSPSSYM